MIPPCYQLFEPYTCCMIEDSDVTCTEEFLHLLIVKRPLLQTEPAEPFLSTLNSGFTVGTNTSNNSRCVCDTGSQDWSCWSPDAPPWKPSSGTRLRPTEPWQPQGLHAFLFTSVFPHCAAPSMRIKWYMHSEKTGSDLNQFHWFWLRIQMKMLKVSYLASDWSFFPRCLL